MGVTQPAPIRTRTGWRTGVKKAADRVPTKWFITALSLIFLGASAAFGGLADAAEPPVTRLEPGETYEGAQLAITVDRAVLIDAFPEQFIVPEEGNRLLVIVAVVENVFDKPVTSTAGFGLSDNLRLVGVDGLEADAAPSEISILSDSTSMPVLQPNVPVEVGFMWEVDDDALSDGEAVTIDIIDKTYVSTGAITYGERFESPFVAATTQIELTDVGAGTAPE